MPGCVATGATREEVEKNMYEAFEMHIEGLLEDKLPIPESKSFAAYELLLKNHVLRFRGKVGFDMRFFLLFVLA